MDWVSILVDAGAGALGALVALAFLHGRTQSRNLRVLVVVVAITVTTALGENVVAPRVRIWQADRELRSLPLYAELAQNDPEIYQQIRTALSDGIRQGKSSETVTADVRGIMTRALEKYVGKASDDSVNTFVENLVDQLSILDSQSPDACYRYLFPDQPASRTLAVPNVTPEMRQHTLDTISAVVHSAIHNPQELPDEGEAAALMEPVSVSLAREFGTDLLLLQRPATDTTERHKVCQVASRLYKLILGLEEQESSLLLRNLLSAKPSQ